MTTTVWNTSLSVISGTGSPQLQGYFQMLCSFMHLAPAGQRPLVPASAVNLQRCAGRAVSHASRCRHITIVKGLMLSLCRARMRPSWQATQGQACTMHGPLLGC